MVTQNLPESSSFGASAAKSVTGENENIVMPQKRKNYQQNMWPVKIGLKQRNSPQKSSWYQGNSKQTT